MKKAVNEEIKFPDHWDPMGPDENYKTVDLKSDDPNPKIREEFEWVWKSFMRDTGGRQIKLVKIWRHQNKLTFTRYQIELERSLREYDFFGVPCPPIN